MGGLFGAVQCGQQESRQDRDDRNHDEELYQRKTTSRFTLQVWERKEERGGILAAKMILITVH